MKTVDELKIPSISNYTLDNTIDPPKETLQYFENHPSIANIKREGFDASLAPVKWFNLSKPWM